MQHFAMDLEFLTRRTEMWLITLKTTLFTDGDIVEAGERAEEAEGPRVTEWPELPTPQGSAGSSLSGQTECHGVFDDRHGRIRHLLGQLRP